MLMVVVMLHAHPVRTWVFLSWVVDGSSPLGIDVCVIDSLRVMCLRVNKEKKRLFVPWCSVNKIIFPSHGKFEWCLGFGGKQLNLYFSSCEGARGPVTWMSTAGRRQKREMLAKSLQTRPIFEKHWQTIFPFTYSQVGTRDWLRWTGRPWMPKTKSLQCPAPLSGSQHLLVVAPSRTARSAGSRGS